ncbi:sodium- and chloride-dependent glycine transporter 1-like [Saccostrea echinata]|uniref:sodium- and chloride-dependent glycine transporter 1-like n=1 Tax=Saccostrea echinata TaxID=191078 RepID=UPI002A7F8DCE|nr:sodium- and chloride-dependent glycine transporter 1-like [Saccostrea echinata]
MGGFRTDQVLQIKMRKTDGKFPPKDLQNGGKIEDGVLLEELQNGGKMEDGDVSEEDYQRGTWSHKLDFLLSVIGYSVGVSNIWRFPYLCIRNGGGAFLIPFFFFLIFCGIPLYFLELCLGQFSGVSSIFVWKLCPLFKGLGFLMVIVSALMSWYYITVIVWVLYYLVNSFFDPLPWSVCTESWNTEYCIESRAKAAGNVTIAAANSSFYNITGMTRSGFQNGTFTTSATTQSELQNTSPVLTNSALANVTITGTGYSIQDIIKDSPTAAKEFWQRRVLRISSGFDNPGSVEPHLIIGSLVAWVLVFFCLMKGVKSVGKVVYVTAVLPYILLTVFLIRGLMLEGSVDGIMYYLTPDFSRLSDFQVWLEAGIQVFYSLGPAWGGLITMSSYNKFNNNCFRDAIIGSLADGLTSFYAGFVIFTVLGHLAVVTGLKISDMADSGPGLALVVYPEAMLSLPFPHLWAVLFFLMLLTLGIDSQFGTFETVSSGLVDAFPQYFGGRKTLLTAGLCAIMFILGLPFTTSGGMYYFQIVDWYAASLCVTLTSFLECVIVGWIYGADRFSKDVKMMLGMEVNVVIRVCWCIITPLVMLAAFIITLTNYQPPTYEGYEYPIHARVIGFLLSLIPLVPLPVTAIYYFSKTNGTCLQRLRKLTQPSADWGPHLNKYKREYQENLQNTPDEAPLLLTAKRNLLGNLVR